MQEASTHCQLHSTGFSFYTLRQLRHFKVQTVIGLQELDLRFVF
jgi:hypothetical protein